MPDPQTVPGADRLALVNYHQPVPPHAATLDNRG